MMRPIEMERPTVDVIVPFRSAKMKWDGWPLSTNDVVVLATWPVGPWGPAAVVGMATVSGTFVTPAAVTE